MARVRLATLADLDRSARLVTAQEANDGLPNGRYYMVTAELQNVQAPNTTGSFLDVSRYSNVQTQILTTHNLVARAGRSRPNNGDWSEWKVLPLG